MNINTINKRSRCFFFTLDAREQDGLPILSADAIIKVLANNAEVVDWVFQLERGKEQSEKNPDGFLHYQGCLFLDRSKQRRIKDVHRWFDEAGIDWIALQIIRKSDVAAARYCSKNDTRQAGPWWSSEDFMEQMGRKPTASQQGQRSDLNALAEALDDGMTPDDIILDPNLRVLMTTQGAAFVDRYFSALNKKKSLDDRDVVINYMSGPSEVGKSYYVQRILHKQQDVFKTRLTRAHPFDNYCNQPVLLLEEFRSDIPDVGELYDMLDHYQFEMEARYRNKFALWKEVWITTNWPIERQYRQLFDYAEREPFYRRINNVYVKTGKFQSPFRLGSGREVLDHEFYGTPLNELSDGLLFDDLRPDEDEPLPDEIFPA